MSVWEIKLPQGITEITQDYVRGNMPAGTTEVVIPEGVISIGGSAFERCTSLESVVIPEGVESIGIRAFSLCTSLESVVIPEGVESIGYCAFSLCTSLKSIVISEGVEHICDHAFNGCKSLQSVVIPEGTIGSYAFKDCTSLQTVKILEGVKVIGCHPFRGCKALNLIVLPDVLVDNCARYGITANQTVIKYSDFNDWQSKNGLEGKLYSDQTILFLYQLQNTESFKPIWNEILIQCPEVSVGDLLKFLGKKQMCLPKFFWSNGSRDAEEKRADPE